MDRRGCEPYALTIFKSYGVSSSATLVKRDALLRQLKQNLLVAKHRIEMQANRKRCDVEFHSDRIGKVVYRLALLDASKIHPVFHVSLLKPILGPSETVVANLPEEEYEGHLVEQPLAVCATRMVL
ncbi:hypothetical protein Tco_0475424 [Tanacetum coccineum]